MRASHPATRRKERNALKIFTRPTAWRERRLMEKDSSGAYVADCPHCKHPGTHHFSHTDELGYWAFCVLEGCDCFIDIPQP